MCWIFWYKWNRPDTYKILLHWLERLEYRGYDSAWMVVGDLKGNYSLFKSVWKVANLTENLYSNIDEKNEYSYGIAHTRWATHGWVTQDNTHPHYDSKNEIYLVHNGIIENYEILKKSLEEKWYKFYSQTDTEVVAKLLEDNWQGDLLKSVEKILPMLEWAYALLIISKRNPGEMVWVKYWSPLVFGYTDWWDFFFSSDTQALVWYVENVVYLDDWDLVYVKNSDYLLKSQWKLALKPIEKINVEQLKADKWDFKHYMLKEIYEQPHVLQEIYRWRVNFETNSLYSTAFQELDKHEFSKIVFVACGTSYHAWWLAKYWFEDLAQMDWEVRLASEFEYKTLKVDQQTLYVFISQSWETADSIEALKIVKKQGWKIFGVVNVVGSSISRMSDFGMFTRAGTEIWVASTKAFSAQIMTLLLMALYFWQRNRLSNAKFEKILSQLKILPELMQKILEKSWDIAVVAKELSSYKNFFFLGRHFQLPIANEWSLKLKEISYLHSEAYPSWELKHWPLALIDASVPSVIFAPNDLLYEKNISTMNEIKARDWKVVWISDENISKSDFFIELPKTIDEIYPFLSVLVSQLLAYHVADVLGKDIDKPRNLAKSVTVK